MDRPANRDIEIPGSPVATARFHELIQLSKAPAHSAQHLLETCTACGVLETLIAVLERPERELEASYAPDDIPMSTYEFYSREAIGEAFGKDLPKIHELWSSVGPEGISIELAVLCHMFSAVFTDQSCRFPPKRDGITKLLLALAYSSHGSDDRVLLACCRAETNLSLPAEIHLSPSLFHPLLNRDYPGSADEIAVLRRFIPLDPEQFGSRRMAILCAGGIGELLRHYPNVSTDDRIQLFPSEEQLCEFTEDTIEIWKAINLCKKRSLPSLLDKRWATEEEFFEAWNFSQDLFFIALKRAQEDEAQSLDMDGSTVLLRASTLFMRYLETGVCFSPSGMSASGVYKDFVAAMQSGEFRLGDFLRKNLLGNDQVGDPASTPLSDNELKVAISSNLWRVCSSQSSQTTKESGQQLKRLCEIGSSSGGLSYVLMSANSLYEYGRVFGSFKQETPREEILRVIADFMTDLAPIPAPHAFFMYLTLRSRESGSQILPPNRDGDKEQAFYIIDGPSQRELVSLLPGWKHPLERYDAQLAPGGRAHHWTVRDLIASWRSSVQSAVWDLDRHGINPSLFHPFVGEAFLFALGAYGARYIPTEATRFIASRPWFVKALNSLRPFEGYNYLESSRLFTKLEQAASSYPPVSENAAMRRRHPHSSGVLATLELTPPQPSASSDQIASLHEEVNSNLAAIRGGLLIPPDQILLRVSESLVQDVKEKFSGPLKPQQRKEWERAAAELSTATTPRRLIEALSAKPLLWRLPSFRDAARELITQQTKETFPAGSLDAIDLSGNPSDRVLLHNQLLDQIWLNICGLLPLQQAEAFLERAFRYDDILRLTQSAVSRGSAPIRIASYLAQGPSVEVLGQICDTCATNVEMPSQEAPNLYFFPFARLNGDGREPILQGGSGALAVTTEDGNRALLIRSFNPRDKLLSACIPGQLCEEFIDRVLYPFAQKEGFRKIIVPDDSKDFGVVSNRKAIVNHFREHYAKADLIRIHPDRLREAAFNNYPIQNPCMVVRVVESRPHWGSSFENNLFIA